MSGNKPNIMDTEGGRRRNNHNDIGNDNLAGMNETPKATRMRRGRLSNHVEGLIAFVEKTPAPNDHTAITAAITAGGINVAYLNTWIDENFDDACAAMTDPNSCVAKVLLRSLFKTYSTVESLLKDPNNTNNNADLMTYQLLVSALLDRYRRGEVSGNIAGLVAFVTTPATADHAAVTGALAAAKKNLEDYKLWMNGPHGDEAREAMTDTDNSTVSKLLLKCFFKAYPTVKILLGGDPNGPNNADLMEFQKDVTELLCKVTYGGTDAKKKTRAQKLLGACPENNFVALDGNDGEIASCAVVFLNIAVWTIIDEETIAEDKKNLIEALTITGLLYRKMTAKQREHYMVYENIGGFLQKIYKGFYVNSNKHPDVIDTSKARAYGEAADLVKTIIRTLAE